MVVVVRRGRALSRAVGVVAAAALALVLVPVLPSPALAADGDIGPLAGNGDYGSTPDRRPARTGPLSDVQAVAVSPAGLVHFTDSSNNQVRRIEPDGTLTTVAGNGQPGFGGDGGPAAAARLSFPTSLAFDVEGVLYVGDAGNHRVRRVQDGVISTVLGDGRYGDQGDGGLATLAQLGRPLGLAVTAGGVLLVSDGDHNRVRAVGTDGVVRAFAGDGRFASDGDGGPAPQAGLGYPWGLLARPDGSVLVSEAGTNRVRRVVDGRIEAFAGTGAYAFGGDGGPAVRARLAYPTGLAQDAAGHVFVADSGNYRVRRVAADGTVSTVAGSGQYGDSGDGAPAVEARLSFPLGVAVRSRDLLVADTYSYRVRRVEGAAEQLPPLPTPPLPPAPDPELPRNEVFGGPVVLAGIDAEDGGVGGHGPLENYVQLVGSVLEDVRNDGEGVLVLGGAADDFCTGGFWSAVGDVLDVPVEFAEGAEAIGGARLGGRAAVAVVGSSPETCGGLDDAENEALGARRDEIAAFVNGGGGLVGFTQVDVRSPYSYVSGLGDFAMGFYDTDGIDPTPEGEQVGITDALDVCCWHNSFLSYPEYLQVLASYDDGSAAALGGSRAVLCAEDGLAALSGTPGGGAASGTVHEQVEPVVAGVDGGLGELVHGVNCNFVVPVEDAVDGLVSGLRLPQDLGV